MATAARVLLKDMHMPLVRGPEKGRNGIGKVGPISSRMHLPRQPLCGRRSDIGVGT